MVTVVDAAVALVLTVNFFFFSSRRRHTRFDCDWSSDVCSSDLVEREVGAPVLEQHARASRDHARAKQGIDALDERGGIAVGVDRADEDRVAGQAAEGGYAVPFERAGRIHERAAL